MFAIDSTNNPATSSIGLYTGSAVWSLTPAPQVSYGRDGIGLLFRASAGTIYSIVARTQPQAEGLIRFGLTRASPPPNDDFVNRSKLDGSSITVTANNLDATPEQDDPVADSLGQQTIWWRWTAPASGRVLLNSTSLHGPLNGGVFHGQTLQELVSDSPPSRTWPKLFEAKAGLEYAIGVTTWSYHATELTLSLELLPSPSIPPLAGANVRRLNQADAWPVRGFAGNRELPTFRVPSAAIRSNQLQVIESSADLVHWLPFATNATDAEPLRILPDPALPFRFFRASYPHAPNCE